jgi:hypothetical protein
VTDPTNRDGVALLWLDFIENRILAERGPPAGLAKGREGMPPNRSGAATVSVTNRDGRDALGDVRGCVRPTHRVRDCSRHGVCQVLVMIVESESHRIR